MLLNHKRITVWNWQGDESLCPECGEPLSAKRGDIVVWHWAHKPCRHKKRDCDHYETNWHLRWKSAYNEFENWNIEVPIGSLNSYRIDAMNTQTGRIREFVHSLSAKYKNKHAELKNSGFDVLWIIDGNEFVSLRSCEINGVGIRKMLKPSALEFAESVDFNAIVHYENQLYKHWKNNIWYPIETMRAKELLYRFRNARVA